MRSVFSHRKMSPVLDSDSFVFEQSIVSFVLMDIVVQQLELRYNKFIENRDRDHALYSFNPAYEYMVIIETQPKIKEIIENDKASTEAKKQQIVAQNLLPKDQERMLNKINRSSLSFYYSEIYRDVYVPMTKYKTALRPLTHWEIVGSTKLFREKFVNAIYVVGAFLVSIFSSYDKKDIDGALSMAKIEYTFTQKKYGTYMERIHAALIPRLLEICTLPKEVATTETLKNKIVISEKKGIYQSGKEQSVYSIGKRTKRFRLIKHLLSKDDCPLSELEKVTNQDGNVVMKSIPEINKLFRENVGVSDDLIIHNDTSGYSLNKAVFDIVLEQ